MDLWNLENFITSSFTATSNPNNPQPASLGPEGVTQQCDLPRPFRAIKLPWDDGLKVEERQHVADTDIDVVALGRSFCRLISNCTHMSGSMCDLNFETVNTGFLHFNI